MDTDVSRWVLEFLLRSSVPDSLISKTLTSLPLSGADFRLKKTLLLRTLQSLHSKASITETALEILELLEEIDRNDAVPITDSMRRAYCAVAVECTVKYLAASPDDAAGNYFDAVRRIWRGRVAEMVENAGGRREALLSDELARWRDDVEAAVWDSSVSERLAGLNSRAEALNEVKVYLKEAWEVMGPSFLESVAAVAKAKGLGLEGVCEFGSGGEPVRKSDGGVEGSRKEGREFVGMGELENDDDDNEKDDNNDDEHDDDDDDDACCMGDENQGKEEELEERVGASVLNQEYPAEGEKEIQKSNLQLKRKHSALRRFPDSIGEFAYGGGLVRKRNEGLKGSTKGRRDFVGGDRRDPIDGEDGSICCMEDAPVAGEKRQKEQVEGRAGTSVDRNQELGGHDLSAKTEKEIQKGNVQLKGKHIALRRCHKGVKISGTEEVEPENSRGKYDPFPSPEVKEVQESLKSSSLELRALVKDPLPDALRTSEVVRSKLAAKDINHGPHVENQSGDVDAPDPDVCKSIVLYRPNDANFVKKSSVHCNNVHCPKLMEPKSTACTYEWDDSIDNLPQGKQPRRRKRKWTSLEEETLRNGIKKFGEGNWTAIRSFYSNIFENRTGGDLKDKWRNMMR